MAQAVGIGLLLQMIHEAVVRVRHRGIHGKGSVAVHGREAGSLRAWDLNHLLFDVSSPAGFDFLLREPGHVGWK